jgi:hypothetical protein
MAVAYRSKDIKGLSAGTSVVHSAPAGLADNDILVLFLAKGNANAVTVPAGFSDPVTVPVVGNLYVSWKRASSESGTYTFSCNNNGKPI